MIAAPPFGELRPAHARSSSLSSVAAKTGTNRPATFGGCSPSIGSASPSSADSHLKNCSTVLVAGVGVAVTAGQPGHPPASICRRCRARLRRCRRHLPQSRRPTRIPASRNQGSHRRPRPARAARGTHADHLFRRLRQPHGIPYCNICALSVKSNKRQFEWAEQNADLLPDSRITSISAFEYAACGDLDGYAHEFEAGAHELDAVLSAGSLPFPPEPAERSPELANLVTRIWRVTSADSPDYRQLFEVDRQFLDDRCRELPPVRI